MNPQETARLVQGVILGYVMAYISISVTIFFGILYFAVTDEDMLGFSLGNYGKKVLVSLKESVSQKKGTLSPKRKTVPLKKES